MRVLLPLLLIVVLSGCGSPEPVAEPVAEKAIDPQPVAPKAETQPAAAQPEQPKSNPAPDAAGPQSAPANPPANPQPAQPPVVEKPQQPVVSNLAPGKVPLLVSVRTKAGKKHVGELIERTDAGLVVYDIVLRDTISITKDQVLSFVEGIDERTASSHVPFATYAAWKLNKLLRIGTVQGRIALASDQGIFINLGSEHGLVAGQLVTLLGKAEEITDPESGEQLAVYRAPVATLVILAVVNERLSKLSITAPDEPVKIERGMTVACERGSTTIVVIPPQWKSEDPNLKTGDEALYLTEHIITELVRFGVPTISLDQSDQIRDELANKKGQPNETVSPISIAEELRAGVLVTGQILAKGQTGNVTLHVTDLATRQYVGILAGRIRRDKIREESKKAKKAADDIKKQVSQNSGLIDPEKLAAKIFVERGYGVWFHGKPLLTTSDIPNKNVWQIEMHGDRGRRISTTDVKVLANFKALLVLRLQGVGLTDEGVRHLCTYRRLKSLKVLGLVGNPLTNESLSHIAKLSELQTLNIASTNITDLASLSPLKNLQELYIYFLKIDDSDLRVLLEFPNLKTLSLSGTPITDKSISTLTQLRNLTHLRITGTHISPLGAAHISKRA